MSLYGEWLIGRGASSPAQPSGRVFVQDKQVIEAPDPGTTVKRFVIPGGEGYSEFWRRDKSPVEPVELAKLLLALRKVASFVGRNVGDIVWSGMEAPNGIALDPTPIMGQYPVPAAMVDLMAGLAIQEAFKRTEWSERIREIGKAKLQIPPQYEYKFDLFFNICECVYVDGLANRNVLGYYTEVARKWRIEKNARQLISPPTVSEVLHIWWRMAADRNENTYKAGYTDRSAGGLVERGRLDKFYKNPVDLLNTILPALRHDCVQVTGVAERGDYRLSLYLSIWRDFLDYVKFWPADRSDKFLIPEELNPDLAREEEDRKAIRATIVSYAQLIERAIPRKKRDFTEEVKDNVANADNVAPIQGNDILMLAQDRVDQDLLHKLKRVVRSVAQRTSSFNRGLKSGKIQRRRLYRAHTTGAVFQQKHHEFELRNDIVILVDATGSMADPTKWHKTEVIYQTLFSAIHAYSRNARIFAYNEVRNACRISELYQGGRMLTVLPHGKTASGEAIIATAISTKSKNRKRLIIHITDGASNWGCGVDEAIAYCKKRGGRLITLGVGCSASAKQSLRDEYGKLVEFVDDTEKLPRLLGALLNYDMRRPEQW